MASSEESRPFSLRHASRRAVWAALRRLLRTRIMAGVLTVLPIWVTYAVVKFVFNTLRDASEPLARWVTEEYAKNPLSPVPAFLKPRLDWLVPVFAVLLTLSLLYMLGLFTANVFGRRVISGLERLVDRVPLVKTVYRSTKQVISTLAGQTGMTGAKVVLVEFPRPGMKCIGFLTSMIKDKDTGQDLCMVFIATTPNPTTGYMQIVPVEEVSEIDMSIEEAAKLLVSGGVLAPSEMMFHRINPPKPTTENTRKDDGASPALS